MFTCFYIYLLSVRTLCDPLYLPTLILRGACNQGERFFIFILVASLVDTRSVNNRQKKRLPYESFSTFLCQTLKRIYPRIVEDNWKRSRCRITTQPVSFHKPNQVSLQVRLLNIGLMEQRLFFLLVWQLQYQHHTFLTVFEHGRKLV